MNKSLNSEIPEAQQRAMNGIGVFIQEKTFQFCFFVAISLQPSVAFSYWVVL